MKNMFKTFGILFITLVIGFSAAACAKNVNDSRRGNELGGRSKWIDPATQTKQLSGGQELLSYTGGNRMLPGSPYGYETWDFRQGGESYNIFTWYGAKKGGGGAFKAEWEGYFLARLGFFWGNGGEYTQYDNIYVDYNYLMSGYGNGGFIGVYGWSRNPSAEKDIEKLIEYYIVDDWFYKSQMGGSQIAGGASNVTKHGSFTADGATYEIFTGHRINQPSIDGTKTFTQIFSVRQGKRSCGTISVTEHYKEWSKYLTLGNLYEAKFKVESFGGSGVVDLTYLHLSQEKEARYTAP